MKKFLLAFFLLTGLFPTESASFFYSAEIEGKDLRLVMEKIDSRNHSHWHHYATIQGMKGNDGRSHFKRVLQETDYSKNEVWVAYITRAKNPTAIPYRIEKDYDYTSVTDKSYKFANNIEMFMSVTSSPHALITSHMGISSSIEGVSQRTKGTSIDLHSYAAKVMLMLNPERRYMVTTPNRVMGNIILKALPKNAFFGTLEEKNSLETYKINTCEKHLSKMMYDEEDGFEVSDNNDSKKTVKDFIIEEIESSYQNNCKMLNRFIKKRLNAKQNRQEILKKTLDYIEKKSWNIEINDNLKAIPSPPKIEQILNTRINESYSTYLQERSYYTKFLEKMKIYPPIFSVDKTTRFSKAFSMYSPDNKKEPWLTIKKDNPHYQWMNLAAFTPGATRYLAVDLKSLAESRAIKAL